MANGMSVNEKRNEIEDWIEKTKSGVAIPENLVCEFCGSNNWGMTYTEDEYPVAICETCGFEVPL